MKIKDPFSYSTPFDSIGLDCCSCKYFDGPIKGQDKNFSSRCSKHDIPLVVRLDPKGFRRWEWFCRSFSPSPGADVFSKSYKEFTAVRKTLNPDVLYRGYSGDGYLVGYPFESLRKAHADH